MNYDEQDITPEQVADYKKNNAKQHVDMMEVLDAIPMEVLEAIQKAVSSPENFAASVPETQKMVCHLATVKLGEFVVEHLEKSGKLD